MWVRRGLGGRRGPTKMSSAYEIIYLPIRGRAEVLRIALAAANVSYKDTSIGGGDLPAFKATSLLGECTGLPVLRVTDAAGVIHEIPQSYAILRFLAHAHGLIPSEPLLRARADVVAETHLDWRLGAFNPVAFKPGFLADRAAVVTYFKDKVPKYLEVFERLLPADGPPRFAGSELSYADIAVYETLDRHLLLCPTVLANHPRLAALIEAVSTEPGVAKYLEARRGPEPHFAAFVAAGVI